MHRVRDFATAERDVRIGGDIAASSLDRLAVDHVGLDALDRGYLSMLRERFDGGHRGRASRTCRRAQESLRLGWSSDIRRAVEALGR